MQAKLITTESKLITLESEMREMKTDYESKITSLESTVAAKDIHIKQLVSNFYMEWIIIPLHGTLASLLDTLHLLDHTMRLGIWLTSNK